MKRSALKTILSAVLVGLMFGSQARAAMTDVGWVEMNNFVFETNNILGNVTGLAMSASAHKVAYIFRVPKTGTISKVGFRVNAVTVSDTLSVGLQTIDGTNSPSGSNYGGSTPGTVSGLTANTGYTVTLGANATATQGDTVAVVIAFNAYVAGNITIGVITQSTIGNGYPTTKLFTASWAASNNSPVFWIEYNDGSYAAIPNTYPFVNGIADQIAVNNGSTPDEYALRFSLPFKARLTGVRPYLNIQSAANININVYDSDGSTVLTSVVVSSGNAVASRRPQEFIFPSSVVLSTGTVYRVSIRPNNATSVDLDFLQLPSNAAQAQLGGGTSFYVSTRTDSGAWSDATDRRLPIGLIFDQVDFTASGGGGGGSGSGFNHYPFHWK